MRDDPERTVVHANDDHTVVPVETSLYESSAGHRDISGQLAIAPAGPLSCHNVPRLECCHLGVSFRYLEIITIYNGYIIVGKLESINPRRTRLTINITNMTKPIGVY